MIDTRVSPAGLRRGSVQDAGARGDRSAVDPSGRGRVPMRRSTTPRFHLAHVPALDGLRGFAIAGVLLFHTQLLTGGYLGISLFFSLSGFLITTLLLEERITTHGIRLKDFWIRRARRLLPALLGLLVAVAVYARFFGDPVQVARVRGDSLATLFYVANWHSIVAGQGYWDLFSAPSLLQHTWSLAIEEQFYLVWPLILGTLLWWGRGSVRVVLAFCMALALAGTVWMAIVFDPDDVSRAYLGTDTRMPALLVGAALAAWLQRRGPTRSYVGRVALEVVTLVSVAALLLMWILLDGTSPFLYRGGLFLGSLAGCALLASASHPVRGPVAAVLSWRPLCGLGIISYGLYLWHWPVIVVLDQQRTGLDGLRLAALQITVSIAVAVVSYVVLEQPIRRRGLAAWRWRRGVPIAAVLSVGLAVLLVSLPVNLSGDQSAIAALQDADTAAAARLPLPIASDLPVARAAPDRIRPDQPLPRLASRQPREMFVGDSVSYSLGSAMATEPDRWQTNIAMRAIVGCTVDDYTGRTRSSKGVYRKEDPVCQAWPTRYAADVQQFKPDAVLVAFGGLQSDARLLPDGQYHSPCDAPYIDWYQKEWDRAIKVLGSEGAIVFVTLPAYVNLAFTYPDFNDSADCLKPAMRRAVEANPAIARLVPLDSWVCPTRQTCRDQENGYQLRFDLLHYAGQGASVPNQWLQDQIFQPPPRRGTGPAR